MASEITIVGAGIFGLSCAWELARRGAKVRVIEADRVGAGSSGGTVGALAPHAPENWNPKKAMQRDALVAAEAWWAEIAAAGGVDAGYARSGRLQPAPAEALMHTRIDAARANWKGFSYWLAEAPEGLVTDFGGQAWVRDDFTARIAPRRAVASLAAAIRSAGGFVEEGAGTQHPEAQSGTVIWATGLAGLEALTADLGRKMGSGVKGQSAVLEFDAAVSPQVFYDGLHIVPHADGTVAIGSTSENDVLSLNTDAQLDALIEKARAVCPVLRDAKVIDRWAGIRPRAKTRAPLVGPWPGRPGHLIANGGFKIGFGMAPAVAGMLATLILDGEDTIPPEFLPERC